MARYLLSVHAVQGEVAEPMSDEEMQRSYGEMNALNEEIRAAGAWVFGGALLEPDAATVVRASGGEVLTTDGPFAESKEQIAGFYIIEAADSEEALSWAAKTSAIVRKPIEVRRFRDDADA